MHLNNECMFYAQYASIVVCKSQNGAETLVNLGARKKLTCFDPLRKGCRIFFNLFFDNYWSSTLYLQHSTYKIILMKYFCFKILPPVQPLPLSHRNFKQCMRPVLALMLHPPPKMNWLPPTCLSVKNSLLHYCSAVRTGTPMAPCAMN